MQPAIRLRVAHLRGAPLGTKRPYVRYIYIYIYIYTYIIYIYIYIYTDSEIIVLTRWGSLRLAPITHALYFEIYTTAESIAGYEAYVCVCFFMYKTVCAAFIWLPWDARSCPYVCLYCAKYSKNKKQNVITKKYLNKNEKHFFLSTKSRDAAAIKNRYKRSRDK